MEFIKNKIGLGVVLIVIIAIVFIGACSKNRITTNPNDKLEFSSDTIQFDTIFTGIGTSTQRFTVKNSNKSKSIIIDRIYLGKDDNSNYRLNINGSPTKKLENYELAAGDSIFLFVEVTIDTGRDEMIEQDSIVFVSNGNIQDVKLIAFGQDVTLINGKILQNDTVWTANKPVLIFNSAMVDTMTNLRLEAGTKVYFHRGSSLFVKGSLIVNGEPTNRVLFASDRLEYNYEEVAGQWGAYLEDEHGNTTGIFGGIHLLAGSRNNIIKNADIKNALVGLQVDSCVTPGTPTVKLVNTNIENSKIIGLYALGASVQAENCVFANSGQHNVACLIGGEYSFLHCTMANYWGGSRKTPQLVLNNYYSYYNSSGAIETAFRDLEDAYFGNCIVYGNQNDEIEMNLSENALSNFRFENCIIKYSDTLALTGSSFFVNNIFNKDPKFTDIESPFDYSLDTLSPAKDAAKIEISNFVPNDQNGNSRLSDSKPDIGAYERIE